MKEKGKLEDFTVHEGAQIPKETNEENLALLKIIQEGNIADALALYIEVSDLCSFLDRRAYLDDAQRETLHRMRVMVNDYLQKKMYASHSLLDETTT